MKYVRIYPITLYGLIFVLSISTLIYVGSRYSLMQVASSSMETTLTNGDGVLVDTCEPLTPLRESACSAPRGKIVVFRSPSDSTLMVKRVVAIGGDSVQISGGRLLVNGIVLSEPYVRHSASYIATKDSWPIQARQVAIPPRFYFVLGDNRDQSVDSRVLGPIKQEAIVGVIKLRIMKSSNRILLGGLKWL